MFSNATFDAMQLKTQIWINIRVQLFEEIENLNRLAFAILN